MRLAELPIESFLTPQLQGRGEVQYKANSHHIVVCTVTLVMSFQGEGEAPVASQGQSSAEQQQDEEGQRDAVKCKPSSLSSFWIPSLTPDAKPAEIKKPVSMSYTYIM